MLQKIAEFIMKKPMKIIFIGVILLASLLIGATQVELKTGNDTLIQDDTSEYIDNYNYQEEFGSDPILVVFKGDDLEDLFSVENMNYMSELENELSFYDEIFTINSPVSLVYQFSGMQSEQYQTALLGLSNGLSEVSTNLETMSESMLSGNNSDLSDNITTLTDAIDGMIEGQENLELGITSVLTNFTNLSTQILTITDTVQVIIDELDSDAGITADYSGLTTANAQLITLANTMSEVPTNSEGLTTVTSNTVTGLNGVLTGLTTLVEQQTQMSDQLIFLANNLSVIADNLMIMSNNLQMIHTNFNSLAPTIPSEQSTLDLMIYDESGNVRSMFNEFVYDETNMMFIVVLDGEVSDEIKTDIVDTIKVALEDMNITDSTLVSGKPVLDLSIKTEMMASMKTMMGLSALIMIVVLLIVFRVRWSLLPLAIILLAVGVTIGIMGWLGIGLTMVSMAVFPVLIGLGIDYSIQFQSRFSEEMTGGVDYEQ
jgi:predicted RND superfamily exporter protein